MEDRKSCPDAMMLKLASWNCWFPNPISIFITTPLFTMG